MKFEFKPDVFPARVGMNRQGGGPADVCHGVPRASGDEPHVVMVELDPDVVFPER